VAKKIYTCRILARKPKRKRPFGRPRHSWKNNITIVRKKQDGNA
jgi:hypothetical protein